MKLPCWAVILLPVLGFAITWAAIPWARKWAPRYGLVAQPGGRRNHAQDTPLTGGWALYLPLAGAFLGLFGLLLAGRLTLPRSDWLRTASLFLGTTWILILGTIDDRMTLSWKKKLLGQLLGGLILILGGHNISVATIPWLGPVDFGWYGLPFLLVAVITITNAINLIDGLDGLAGGICFFAAVTCAVIALVKKDVVTATLGFTLSGSLLGFLRFNFPPATIFLGDGGSMMLGFLLGTLSVSSAALYPGQRLGTSIMIIAPFLPLGIPLFDVALSVARRWLSGRAVFLGDGNHLHHRLLGKIKAARPTVAIFYFFSASLCCLTLLLVLKVQSPVLRPLAGVLTVVLMLAFTWSLMLYSDRGLSLTLRNRPHFKFLGEFLRFMKMRINRTKSAADLLALLEAGVRDLDFDRVEVFHQGEAVKTWINPRPVHPESPRLSSEESFNGWNLKIRWAQPLHGDDGYNEYLLLTWHRFLAAVKAGLPDHAPELSAWGNGGPGVTGDQAPE